MNELWELERLSTGERTALKRAAGTLALNAAALRAFYKADVCRQQSWESQRYAAMCMACLWGEQDTVPTLKMEECLKRMCWVDGEWQESLARRVDALLETRWGDDDYLIGKLLNLVRMMRAKGEFRPDFQKLAQDLRCWNFESRMVQREWLRVIYKKELNENENRENADILKEVTIDAD